MKILVTGASGFLGSGVLLAASARGFEAIGTGRSARPAWWDGAWIRCDLLEGSSGLVRQARCGIVVHCAACPDLSSCARNPEAATTLNVGVSESLASECARSGTRFVLISTDQVFDGKRGGYGETDSASPINIYGRTKREAEERVLTAHDGSICLRLGLVYGPSATGNRSASEQIVGAPCAGNRLSLYTDEVRTPIHVADCARLILDLALLVDAPRIVHLAGPDRVSRYDFGIAVASAFGLAADFERARQPTACAPGEARPRDVSLDSSLLMERVREPARRLADALAADARMERGASVPTAKENAGAHEDPGVDASA